MTYASEQARRSAHERIQTSEASVSDFPSQRGVRPREAA